MDLLEVVKDNDKQNLKGLVNSGIYKSEDEVMHFALKQLLENNPEQRLKLAVHRYQNKEISLGKAAEIAGLCWEEMKDVLIRNGIKPRLGPQTIEEAREDSLTIERFLNATKSDRK
jgi:predicted HTH domain antitoxin